MNDESLHDGIVNNTISLEFQLYLNLNYDLIENLYEIFECFFEWSTYLNEFYHQYVNKYFTAWNYITLPKKHGLIQAIVHNNFTIIQELTKDLNEEDSLLDDPLQELNFALIFAVMHSNVPAVEFLIQKGANNIRECMGVALMNNKIELARMLEAFL